MTQVWIQTNCPLRLPILTEPTKDFGFFYPEKPSAEGFEPFIPATLVQSLLHICKDLVNLQPVNDGFTLRARQVIEEVESWQKEI